MQEVSEIKSLRVCVMETLWKTYHPREITYRDKAEPALTITVQMISFTRTAPVTVLPDSGVDILAYGQIIFGNLGHHLDNLAPSEISPQVINRACMKPMGRHQLHQSTRKKLYRDTSTYLSWSIRYTQSYQKAQYPYPERVVQSK